MTVVTLERFYPPARDDEPTPLPWTAARMEASADGPLLVFADRGTVTFDPLTLDTDPTNPRPRDLTTQDALLTDAWWRVVFIDAQGNESVPSEPVPWVPWRPSVQDVADKVQEHTRDPIEWGGGISGVFDAHTVPRASQVNGFISGAVDEVQARTGVAIRASLFGLARTAAAWHAAAAVADMIQKQAPSDESGFRWMERQYVGTLNDLKDQARRQPVRLR